MVSMRSQSIVFEDRGIDVFVLQCGLGAIEVEPFPVANPGLKLDAEQVREPEVRRALALRVGVDRIPG
jgi:hypothetical protein